MIGKAGLMPLFKGNPALRSNLFVLCHFHDRRSLLDRNIVRTDTSIVPHFGMVARQEQKVSTLQSGLVNMVFCIKIVF